MSIIPDFIEMEKNEDIEVYINRLHDYYLEELKTEDFSYEGKFIYHKSEPDVDGKDGGFWHMITKDFLDQKKRPVSIPCKASNGMMVCTHFCHTFQSYDPYRTKQVFRSSGQKEKPRFICLNRCKRINWIKPIIKKAESNPELFKIWKKRIRPNQVNTHIWLEEEDFLIVLGRWKDSNNYNMITSFVTNYKAKKKQCNKDHEKYLKNNYNPI